jgi:hypothetical protein
MMMIADEIAVLIHADIEPHEVWIIDYEKMEAYSPTTFGQTWPYGFKRTRFLSGKIASNSFLLYGGTPTIVDRPFGEANVAPFYCAILDISTKKLDVPDDPRYPDVILKKNILRMSIIISVILIFLMISAHVYLSHKNRSVRYVQIKNNYSPEEVKGMVEKGMLIPFHKDKHITKTENE